MKHELKKALSTIAVLSLFSFQGCSTASTPIPLDQAIYKVESNLQKAAPVYLADLADKKSPAYDLAVQGIQRAQCAAFNEDNRNGITSNPFVPVMTKEFSIALAGTFSVAGGGGVAAIGAVPTGSLSFTVTTGQTQTLTVPLTFVTLASLPNLYLSQNLAYVNAAPEGDQKTKWVKEILDTRDNIEGNIKKLMAVLPTSATCKNLAKGSPPYAPALD